jgi:hypothetical protein
MHISLIFILVGRDLSRYIHRVRRSNDLIDD